jgi:hypothetical protein
MTPFIYRDPFTAHEVAPELSAEEQAVVERFGIHDQLHTLKIWPDYFSAILDGSKTFEIRVNDRDYMEGDTLRLREYDIDTDTYTGREITRRVGWMASADHDGALVVMSLLPAAGASA